MSEKNSLIAQIVSSYASRPDATIENIVALASKLNTELDHNETFSPPNNTGLSAEKAITQDKIFCLCCGKGFKMLKRHLGAEHGMSEQAYRETFNLSEDYPLVAPNYSERKANYARSVGFGKYNRSAVEAN